MDGSYIVNLGECNSIGSDCVTLYVNRNNVTYFIIFGVECIPKEIENFISNHNIITNIYNNKYLLNVMPRHCGDIFIYH